MQLYLREGRDMAQRMRPLYSSAVKIGISTGSGCSFPESILCRSIWSNSLAWPTVRHSIGATPSTGTMTLETHVMMYHGQIQRQVHNVGF